MEKEHQNTLTQPRDGNKQGNSLSSRQKLYNLVERLSVASKCRLSPKFNSSWHQQINFRDEFFENGDNRHYLFELSGEKATIALIESKRRCNNNIKSKTRVG
jgi:hypothetical protein